MLEQIGIDREIKKDLICDILTNEFTDFNVYFLEHEKTLEVENKDYDKRDTIRFSIFKTESEFPYRIEVYGFPDKNNEEREQYLAKIFSDKLNCKTITSYTDKGDPDCPYYSIIFENGLAYLADDYDTIWGDGVGGEVKVIEEIKFLNYIFDKKGNLKMGSS